MTTRTLYSCNLALVCLAITASAAPPRPVDRGPLAERERQTPISVTIALALPGLAEAEKLQAAIYTPGTPEYHQFLTPDQFAARFGPSDPEVARVIAALGKYGLSAERTTATSLNVTGMPADMERAFSVTLHRYEVAAPGSVAGYTFRAPATRPAIQAEISTAVRAVVGLDNRPLFHPAYVTPGRSRMLPPAIQPTPSKISATPDSAFGFLTVTNFANQYDVDPLYKLGVSGSGSTIGIITLAAFTPSDVFAYWAAVGLTVAPNRIAVINIDGGPGLPSDLSGSIETSLDVEQSGGIAPGAKIIVYQAPNTAQGFLDAFAQAIEANRADSFSASWGAWEWLQNLENAPVIDPIHGGTAAFTQALHELLLQASIQGQTAFAASGDGGAYDVNHDLGCFGPYNALGTFSCSLTISVDYPASDPYITAAGGTTLSGHQEYCLSPATLASVPAYYGCPLPYYQVQTSKESVWGWDYFAGLWNRLGTDPISLGLFPIGSGGGVSTLFPEPSYQSGLPGIQVSQPGQTFNATPEFGLVGLPYVLPAGFAGRNVPDISFDADPDTGYVIYYTSDVFGFGAFPFVGGTSFVAPQLNGVTALLNQYLGKRVGFLNPTLYGLVATGQAYGGSNSPLNQVKAGDNWFYPGSKGYNLGTGLGTVDVFNFANYLGSH